MTPSSVKAAVCAVALAAVSHAGPRVGPSEYYVPAYYPAPYGGWVERWESGYSKAHRLLQVLTLAEKTNITGGTGMSMAQLIRRAPCLLTSFIFSRCNGNTGSVPRIEIPQMCFNEGPHGVSEADHVTVFPSGITAGATFDKRLMYVRGVAIGTEARGKGVNVWLGPTVGPLGRKPKGSRNWEGFGADPVLQAVGARETIRGVQEQGVIAAVKHFVGFEQHVYRVSHPLQPAYNANIDDRVLHELYMWPFAEAVHAGVGAVVMAQNAVNGTECSQHPYLINGLLKDELGFQGFVMSDWSGHMSGVASALAGLDMDMPGDTLLPVDGASYWKYELTRAALNGSVPMARINDMTTRVLAAWYHMGQDQADFPATNFATHTRERVGPLYPGGRSDGPVGVVNEFVRVQSNHGDTACMVARDAITMLKNDASLLPLSTASPLHVFATDPARLIATADYTYFDSPITALRARADKMLLHSNDSWPLRIDPARFDEVALVFIDAGAGTHGGHELVRKVAERFHRVVVVAHTGGPLVVEPWIDLPSVEAVLVAHLPGQEAGASLADVIFGVVSPSGHLPYSITRAESDLPRSVTEMIGGKSLKQPQDTYSKGLFIDYRWLNERRIQPRYAFGHGLSYTSFAYDQATITKVTQLTKTPPPRPKKHGLRRYAEAIPPVREAVEPDGFRRHWRFLYPWLSRTAAEWAIREGRDKYPYPDGYRSVQRAAGPRAGGGEGGNPALWDVAYTISVRVVNTGDLYAGKASVQAYLQFPNNTSYKTPVIQLRDFEKTDELRPGESATVQLRLTRKDLSVWDVVRQDWVVPVVDGGYKVWLGPASDDLRVVCHVDSLKCEDGVAGPV